MRTGAPRTPFFAAAAVVGAGFAATEDVVVVFAVDAEVVTLETIPLAGLLALGAGRTAVRGATGFLADASVVELALT